MCLSYTGDAKSWVVYGSNKNVLSAMLYQCFLLFPFDQLLLKASYYTFISKNVFPDTWQMFERTDTKHHVIC